MLETYRLVRRVALWLLFFSPAFAQAQTVHITGTVRDAQRGDPLVGIPVYLLGTSSVAITGADGQFALNGVQVGQVILMASHKGYAPQTDTLVVSGDSDLTNDFDLTPIAGGGNEQGSAQQAIEPEDERSAASTDNQGSRTSELKTVCACFESAITILDDALSIRKGFRSIEEYQEDGAAVDQMKSLLDTWRQTQQYCLIKFGTNLFTDSACNRPDEVSERRSMLSSLGIKT